MMVVSVVTTAVKLVCHVPRHCPCLAIRPELYFPDKYLPFLSWLLTGSDGGQDKTRELDHAVLRTQDDRDNFGGVSSRS